MPYTPCHFTLLINLACLKSSLPLWLPTREEPGGKTSLDNIVRMPNGGLPVILLDTGEPGWQFDRLNFIDEGTG